MYASASQKIKLNKDDWQKFQLINFGLCIGMFPLASSAESITMVSCLDGAKFGLGAGKVSKRHVLELMQSLQHVYNRTVDRDKDAKIPADILPKNDSDSLFTCDIFGKYKPFDYIKNVHQMLIRVEEDELAKEFLDSLKRRYNSAISHLSTTDWGKNIAEALAENKELIKLYQLSLKVKPWASKAPRDYQPIQ